MNNLEEKLHDALRRKDPPPGFAGRVLTKVQENSPGWKEAFFALFRLPLLRRGFAGICICILIAAAVMYQFQTQHTITDEERAGEQVIQALRITSVELNAAYDRVAELVNDSTR